jgi:hypothetical protein
VPPKNLRFAYQWPSPIRRSKRVGGGEYQTISSAFTGPA